jgi:hypothetical protein
VDIYLFRGIEMYGLRNSKTKEYIKVIPCEFGHPSLCFSEHCIEINYYVSCSLGFICSVLEQEGPFNEETPYFYNIVITEELEVVDLRINEVVPLSKVFDGWDLTEIPKNKQREWNHLDSKETIEFENDLLIEDDIVLIKK